MIFISVAQETEDEEGKKAVIEHIKLAAMME